MRLSRTSILAAWIVAVTACRGGDAAAPSSRPAFAIVAGAGASDTVGATLAQPLVAEIRDAHGNPRSGVVVRFDALSTTDTTRRTETAVSVARLATASFATFAVDTSDVSGHAKVVIRLGTVAGESRVLVTVSELGARDTARFIVNAGAPTRILLPTRDTAVFVGGTINLNATIVDRFGNRRIGSADFSPGPAIASVDGSGRVTAGDTPGRGFVAIRAQGLIDTFRVSVVPRGTLVVVSATSLRPDVSASIATVELDGSGYRPLTTVMGQGFFPKWSPTGDRIVFHVDSGAFSAHLSIVDLAGKARRLVSSASFITDVFGHFSSDGNWVYFSGIRPTDVHYTLFRIHSDGTGLESIPPADFGQYDSAWRGNPSPDGSKVAYVFTGNGVGPVIRFMDAASRAVTPLDVNGQFPEWSPDGQFIAYTDQNFGRIRIMRSNGTERRIITTSQTYNESAGHSFSRDGQWIVIRGATALDLVNVTTGAIIPLPYSEAFYQPSLKP